jgi:hypothetical protein
MEQSHQQCKGRLLALDLTKESVMGELMHWYRRSHWFVRLVVIANIAHLALETLLPAYYHVLARTPLNPIINFWFFATSLMLPLYVCGELWWIPRTLPQERKAILIDALFAGAWFCILWGTTLYAVTHTIWL